MVLKGPCLSTTMKSTSFCMSFAKTGNWMYPSEYIFFSCEGGEKYYGAFQLGYVNPIV